MGLFRLAAANPQVEPVLLLAEAMGLTGIRAETVATVARAYHPHTATGPGTDQAAADRAVAELVTCCGRRADERTAARICLLVQSAEATAALRAAAREHGSVQAALRLAPPVRHTRRISPDGAELLLELGGDLAFGAGAHACPGRTHALAMVAGLLGEDSP
ncbi:hypothetical protein [Crossiella cryophila]|uniref:Cytochrome P450 n=1 Tax=Crossiella cryophila TaxID=43355 RepID=A0A7W7CI00_9PSEU|nr:hypothetical protein [Crossiella cryophila]MBB4681332.1 hypothetical protein [Crossiella cryophila]